MQKPEFRVRPVIRHVVTRYTPQYPDSTKASLETLGEFSNEAFAEQVAEAMRGTLPKPTQYAVVERGFECVTNVLYFEDRGAADEFVARALEQRREFRVYEREVTDPIALGRMAAGSGVRPVPNVPPRIEKN